MSAARTTSIAVLSAAVFAAGAAVIAPAGAAPVDPPPTVSAAASAAIETGSAAATPFRGKSAVQIRNLAVAAANKATAVRVQLSGLDKEYGKLTYDIRIGSTGAVGVMRVTKPKTGSMKMIRVGNTLYLQGDQGFWGSEAAPGGELYNKWIKVPRSSADYLPIARLTTIGFWANGIKTLRVTRRYPGPKVGTVPTVRLHQPGKPTTELYVASSGQPFPLRLVSSAKTQMSFSAWNQPVTVSAPATDVVVSDASVGALSIPAVLG